MIKDPKKVSKELRKHLQFNVIKFIYKKKDGGSRFASGTTHKRFLEKNYDVKFSKNPKPINEDIITYFDTDKKNWRSFRCENLKDITHIYELNINQDGQLVFIQ